MIMKEFEKEDTGQTYNTHHLPNAFCRGFVDEAQLANWMVSEQGKRKGLGQDSENFGRSFPTNHEDEDLMEEKISVSPRMYGPDS
jgi:hypothetical protein